MQVTALIKRYEGIAKIIHTPVEICNPFTHKKVKSEGIWDTGSTDSSVTKSVAQELGLSPVGKTFVRGVHGIKEVNVYLVTITLANKNVTINARVVECEELTSDNSVGMLIGMNIMRLGDFTISNYQGKTTMSFRVPSIECTDYVKEVNEYDKYLKIYNEQRKHGNEKCPCGSGKLYKNCHGKSKYAIIK